MYVFTVRGIPATKKNNMRIARVKGKPVPIQNGTYEQWRKTALPQLRLQWAGRPALCARVNVRARFYRDYRPDLVNLMQAMADLLEEAGVLLNDRLIVGWDGSRIVHARSQERVEIEITEATP